jgi:predicted  nucleic acid-binding Zn-ribbon protein
MSFRKLFLGTALALGLATAGCDGSSADLEKTKADLLQANQDRNNLKTELDASKTQVTALQNKVTELNGKLATAQTPKAPEAAHASMTSPKKEDKTAHKAAAKPQKG